MTTRFSSVAKRAALLASLLLVACGPRGTAKAFQPERLAREPGWLVVRDVPVVRQTTPSNCGAAAMSMVLGYWGAPMTVEQIASAIPAEDGPPGAFRAGDLRDLARERGLHAFVIAGEIRDLEAQLAKNRPVIVGVVQQHSLRRGLSHYEVVVGYDATTQRILAIDPARGWREDSVAGFMKEWERSGRLALVTFP